MTPDDPGDADDADDAHIRHNREFWDDDADDYQAVHGDDLDARPLAWGAFRAPEDTLRILGDVRDLDLIELGCGAAQWSIALAELGAHCTGLDVSARQLRHGRLRSRVPLVQGDGERLPFTDAAFDVVFCDHGAFSFCDPARIVAETARVLRPGGLLAFCTTHPLVYLTYDTERERQTKKLQIPYRELGRMELGDGTIDWTLGPGDWIRVLRANGFVVEDLVELLAADDATTTYADYLPTKWAQRWPGEWIWKARRT